MGLDEIERMRASADRFISTHRERFGISNGPAASGRREHFQYGFNGDPNQTARLGPRDYFWVDYANLPSESGSLDSEIIGALMKIRGELGDFSVADTGSPFSRMIQAACLSADIPFWTVQIEIPGILEAGAPADSARKVLKTLSFDQYEALMDEAASEFGCHDPFTLGAYLFGKLSGMPHIFECHGLFVENFNFDYEANRLVGPFNWQLKDHERELIFRSIPGVPSFFRLTPGVFRSFLVAQAESGLFRSSEPHSYNHNALILRSVFKDSETAPSSYFWPNERLWSWMRNKERQLLERQTCVQDHWATPVSRLFSMMKAAAPAGVFEGESEYGFVFPHDHV